MNFQIYLRSHLVFFHCTIVRNCVKVGWKSFTRLSNSISGLCCHWLKDYQNLTSCMTVQRKETRCSRLKPYIDTDEGLQGHRSTNYPHPFCRRTYLSTSTADFYIQYICTFYMRMYLLSTQRTAQKFMPSTLPSSLVLGWYVVLFCVCRDAVLYITIIYATINNQVYLSAKESPL